MNQIAIDPMEVLDNGAEQLTRGACHAPMERRMPMHRASAALEQLRAGLRALLAAAERADGAERPNRPERGPGYSDTEWELFLRGWDAHAQAVYESGLRKALVRLGGGA